MKKSTTRATADRAPNKTVAKKPPAKKRPPRIATKKPARKAPAELETTVNARTDIGFGNILYLRGDGPGLSWERGVPMECSKTSVWTWSTTGTAKAFTYKVLVNDISWSVGEDFIAHAGKNNRTTPEF